MAQSYPKMDTESIQFDDQYEHEKSYPFGIAMKLLITPVILGFVLLIASTASQAQNRSDNKLIQAIEMMKASGHTEEQINLVLGAMKKVNDMKRSRSATNNVSEKQKKLWNLMGMSEPEKVVATPIMHRINQKYNADRQAVLDRQIALFNQDHGSKPNARVVLDGEEFELKLTVCDKYGMYNISAEGPPQVADGLGPRLSAHKGYQVSTGKNVDTLFFGVDDTRRYSAIVSSRVFDGERLLYTGTLNSIDNSSQPGNFRIEADCSEAR